MTVEILSPKLVGVKQSVTDAFLLLNPAQTPLLNLLGFSEAVTATNHEWFEDSMFGTESTVNGAVTNVATAVVVADVEPFRVGHIVKVGSEMLKVTAVNVGTKTLTVDRGYAGTTAAAIANGAEIEVQFVEGSEGADARSARYKARVPKNNYTQIFDESISISGTAAAVSQYGVANEYEKEKAKKIIELGLQLEKAIVNGVKYRNGSVAQMGGMRSFIQTNVANASAGALNADMLSDQLQKIWAAGGFKTGGNYKIMVPAKQKRVISAFGKADIRLDRQDNGRGQVVDYFLSDFGSAEILLNDNLSSDEVIIFDTNRTAIRPLQTREFGHTYLGTKGDYTEGMLVGEYTLEFQQEKAHARIFNLA
ncbi:SU10 major capsid protein [Paenisporosarcina sp. NPDC076898]|uniref:SU10 major capsid protein n=1 Tax=unclassified Paenisporosarcina TaxID=2642018 RepID=UPI003D08D70A